MKFTVTQHEIETWTANMVRIPSYPGIPCQEMAVAEYIKEVFDAEGIDCHIDPLEDGRANVVAVLKGTGGGRSLMFNGHMDTVPPYDMEDACNPWIEDGIMHGRGTADMKGELVAAMAAMISLKRQGKELPGDVIFTGVADEEEGSLGCIRLLQAGYTADACIVCEGLGLENIAVIQKGLEWYQIDFTGKTVHGSAKEAGINAIEKASHFITLVEEKLKPALVGRTTVHNADSTVNIAVIKGGTQPSTIAGSCQILLDRRFLPDKETYEQTTGDLQALLDELSAKDPDFHAELSIYPPSLMQDGYIHQGFITKEDDPMVLALKQAAKNIGGIEANNMACPCWTDGGLIGHYAHIPVVVYGPTGLVHAHSKEEAINLEELFHCSQIYQQMAELYCI